MLVPRRVLLRVGHLSTLSRFQDGPSGPGQAANLGPTFLEAKDALNQALMDSKTAKTALNEVEQALDGTRQG